MLQSTLASLKSRVRSLRLFKKQKRKSDVPVDSSSDTKTEKAPDVAPTLEVSLPPPIDIQTEVRYERKMGDSEVSYYLPSRANGVNDMCVLFFFFFICRWSSELIFSTQVSPSRIQGAKLHNDARESARRLGNSPPKTSIARSDGGDARL